MQNDRPIDRIDTIVLDRATRRYGSVAAVENLSFSVGSDEQGAASGVGSFASIIGLLLGGILYIVIGPSTFLFCTGIVLLTAGLFIASRSTSEGRER